MKSMKEQKGRTLTDRDLQGALGGTNSPAPLPGDDQTPDARAQIIDIGTS